MSEKTIVLYPVQDPPGGGEMYESLPITIDGIPGCTYVIDREAGCDVWQGHLYPPAGVKETPVEGFEFDRYLLETKVLHRAGGKRLFGIPGYERLTVSYEYDWRSDDAGNRYFARSGW